MEILPPENWSWSSDISLTKSSSSAVSRRWEWVANADSFAMQTVIDNIESKTSQSILKGTYFITIL